MRLAYVTGKGPVIIYRRGGGGGGGGGGSHGFQGKREGESVVATEYEGGAIESRLPMRGEH